MKDHTPKTTISELLKNLDRFRKDLERCSCEHDAENFFPLMRNLVSYLANINDPLTLGLFRHSEHFRDYQSFFISQQNSYYHAIESVEALSLNQKLQSAGQSILDIFDQEFSRNAYLRIKDVQDSTDLSECGTFAMVGCGPLPATLFYIHEKTSIEIIIGVDNNREAIDVAGKLIEHQEFPRIQLKHVNGMNFNYQEADIIYIANLVSPKRRILNQIIETARNDVKVILRDPYGMGILLSESGMEDLDPRFRLIGEGTKNEYFLSRHFFLRRG
jgi:hypothetical protein